MTNLAFEDITEDMGGGLWVSMVEGGDVYRIDVNTGRVYLRVEDAVEEVDEEEAQRVLDISAEYIESIK